MGIAKDCDQKRVDILKAAKKLADEGAHYLWSAGGAKPDEAEKGGVRLSTPVLAKDNYDGIRFCAATVNYDHTDYICAGRAYHPAIGGKQNVAAMPKVPPAPDQKIKLDTFIDTYAPKPNTQKGWTGSLTPRMIVGNVADYTTGKPVSMDGAIVWGEGCDDTQHFDCGGFVRYVVQKVCTTGIGSLIVDVKVKLANDDFPAVFGQPGARVINEGEQLLPADIFFWNGHVAFYAAQLAETKTVKYTKDFAYPVAQAAAALSGVNYGEKHKGTKIGCIRLSPSVLLHRAVDAKESESEYLDATPAAAQ